jgi:hypothetical protein
MGEPTDFELMRRIQSHERRAHFILKDRYHKRLFDIALAVLKNTHKAHDVVREVFDYIWRESALFDLERDRSVAIWLYELTGFCARERLKRWSWLGGRSAQPRGSLLQTAMITGLSLLVVGLGGYAAWATWQLSTLGQQVAARQPQPDPDDFQQIYRQWQQQAGTQSFTLRAPRFETDTLAQILWSSQQRQLLFLATDFPALPKGKAYQLWVVSQVAAPSGSDPTETVEILEDAGTLTPSPQEGTVQWISQNLATETPLGFLVTEEPQSGSQQPTGPVVLESSKVAPIELGPPKVPADPAPAAQDNAGA